MIYIQRVRSNDIGDDYGKQVELGKTFMSYHKWEAGEIPVTITFCSLTEEQNHLNGTKIKTSFKVRGDERGGDRIGIDCKEYANEDRICALKQFLTDKLNLLPAKDYFILEDVGNDGRSFKLYGVHSHDLPAYLLLDRFKGQVVDMEEPKKADTQRVFNYPLQQIFYGAPGTGKSHKIKQYLAEHNVPKENIFRTTFHPDSDYSTFVGSYKPSKGLRKMYGLNGGTTVAMELDNKHLEEEVITYKFIPQAFLLAYIQAYKKPDEKVFLVIEEINRGNCAQIFGDLFQLLDRDENGKSDYTIKADTDLKKFLIEELGKDNEGIADGELCLPANLYFFATMNTSDQSLFPIDSAFKRRWDWEYEPIKYKNTDWLIEIDNTKYSWVEFQKEVNNRILKDTGSEDKMMGDYFVKPHNKIISKKLFLNKVLFYLWTDVCKDGDSDIFPIDNDFSFSKLYDDNSSQTIHSLMENLGINPVSSIQTGKSSEPDQSDEGSDSPKKLPKYTIDGNPERLTTPNVVLKVIDNYSKLHEDISTDEMIQLWNNISGRKNCLVADWTPSENDNQPFADKRRTEIKWGDNKSVWVLRGWTEELFRTFTRNIKDRFGISIEKVE